VAEPAAVGAAVGTTASGGAQQFLKNGASYRTAGAVVPFFRGDVNQLRV